MMTSTKMAKKSREFKDWTCSTSWRLLISHVVFLDLVLATEMMKKMTRDRITKKKQWKHRKTRANDNGDNGSSEPNPGEFHGSILSVSPTKVHRCAIHCFTVRP